MNIIMTKKQQIKLTQTWIADIRSFLLILLLLTISLMLAKKYNR